MGVPFIMRKLLYMSITISVVIFVASITHYQWRARQANKWLTVNQAP